MARTAKIKPIKLYIEKYNRLDTAKNPKINMTTTLQKDLT